VERGCRVGTGEGEACRSLACSPKPRLAARIAWVSPIQLGSGARVDRVCEIVACLSGAPSLPVNKQPKPRDAAKPIKRRHTHRT